MDKYINGTQVKRILVCKTKKHPEWKHIINKTKFLFWTKYIDYWSGPYFETCSEQEMLKKIDNENSFYKNGTVYQKPHVKLEFLDNSNEIIYFETDEEMNNWFERFIQEFVNFFVYIENN